MSVSNPRRSLCVAALSLAVFAAPVAVGQDLSVTVSPNPAPVGATITVTAQDA